MRKGIFIVITFLIFNSDLSGQHSLIYKLTGLGSEMVYLSGIYGNTFTKIDSCKANNDQVKFYLRPDFPKGVYRISFIKNQFTDIIYNREDIKLYNNIENILDSLKVLSSAENMAYYKYWRYSIYINDSIEMLSEIAKKILESNNFKITPDVDSISKHAYMLNRKLIGLTYNLIKETEGMYVNKLLLAYLEPDWDSLKYTPEGQKFKSRKEFLRIHFFDHVDFSDSTLLNSEVFYVLCTEYLTRFVSDKTDKAYINAVDFILKKCKPGSAVYNYILNLFINSFEDSEWEETYVHLIENYLMQNTCESSEKEKTINEKVAVIKKLRVGNPAPDFKLTDTSGKEVDLYSVKGTAVLLFFWLSGCEHCKEAIPDIKKIHEQYSDSGLVVIGVSADTNRNDWLNNIERHGMNWINLSDLKGFKSPVIEMYNAHSTPNFFILNADKRIYARPYSRYELKQSIQKMLDRN